jgi:acetyl-CoA carboxylase carboxyl transferase subunit alpha
VEHTTIETTTFKTVEQYIMKGFNELKDLSTAELIAKNGEIQ